MLTKENFFVYACFMWYVFHNIPPEFIINFMFKFYNVCHEFLMAYNPILDLYSFDDIDSVSESSDSSADNNVISDDKKQNEVKSGLRYEDKYLEDIRKLNKEWIFDKNEIEQLPIISQAYCDEFIKTKKEKITEIIKNIVSLEKKIAEDIDEQDYVEDLDDFLIQNYTLEERNEGRREEIRCLQEEHKKIIIQIDTEEGLDLIKRNSETYANKTIIDRKLEKLQNCYIMEKTPIGNVLMIYEKERDSFKYYADLNIPYRYLEVVARKYVKTYDCRPIFVDMEEELKIAEDKWEKDQENKRLKEEEEERLAKEFSANNQGKSIEQKKNVFAKFKSYNKEAGGKISMAAAPPKNSIPNKVVSESKEEEKVLLKEKANRYTYEGKFANFNFLKKVEKKVFNKKLALSFADFKKMQQK
jgi:hypothetical protein